MPTGGAFSRTAVNSESSVKSPLGGLVTSGFVILSIYFLTPALFWIPKATLSAIIITAVWQIIIPPATYYTYWRTSLSDFVGSMISFWVTLFVSVEMGIATAVGFSIIQLLLRIVFASLISVTPANMSTHYTFDKELYPRADSSTLPDDTRIFKFKQSILFPNAYRTKSSLINTIQIYSSGTPTPPLPASQRLWSDTSSAGKRITKIRIEAGMTTDPAPLHVVILDLENVAWIDTTGLQALTDAKKDIKTFAGDDVVLRFVGVNQSVRKKFEMVGWMMVDARDVADEVHLMEGKTELDLCFDTMQSAIWAGRVNVEREIFGGGAKSFREAY